MQIRIILSHLINCFFLAGISYFIYHFFRKETIAHTNDIYIKRDLIYVYYWGILLLVFLIYQLYFFTFRVIFKSKRLITKAAVLGFECFILLWLLLSLYHSFNLFSLFKDPLRFVPFIAFVPIGFILPFSAEFFKKILIIKT